MEILHPRQPSLDDVHSRAQQILSDYPELSKLTIWQLVEEVDSLKQKVSSEETDARKLEDFDELLKLTLGMRALNLEVMNEEFREDLSHLSEQPYYSPDRFPREWFLHYVPMQPKFGVGDILFMIDTDPNDATRSIISEVVITCVISDIFEITYLVAKHDLNDPLCEAMFHEVEESRLAFRKQELDPRRKHMEVVKT